MANQTINLNEKMPPEEETEIPSKTLDSTDSSSFPADNEPPASPDGASKEGEEPNSSIAAEVAPPGGNDADPDNDIQKKIRRAERFGMPVQLSEAEKRSSRAERFGTGAGVSKPDVLNKSDVSKSEELKRKARGERFGTSTPSADTADEEAKKKARVARFSSTSAKIDPEEEDKRKARAIRFSNATPSSLSQVNGKEAIAGKTTGGS